MSLQEALKLMRLELGMTQKDLATRLGKAFVTVNRWENGKGFPSRSNAKAILGIARSGHASSGCIDYLNQVLLPNTKRPAPATVYGFPDIDRDFLFQLADGSNNAIYVIECGSYKLLYANQKAERMAEVYVSEQGVRTGGRKLTQQRDRRCYHYFGARNAPCPFCPLKKIDGSGFKNVLVTLPHNQRKLLVHAKETEMGGRAAYIIYLTDITEEDAERSALYDLTNDIPQGVGIYHVYRDGRIEMTFMNRTMLDMLGRERGEALLRDGPAEMCLVHPEDRETVTEAIRQPAADANSGGLDIRIKMGNGQYAKLHVRGKLIKREEERSTYYCVFNKME